jgi:small-conductance mechanosensitive channel
VRAIAIAAAELPARVVKTPAPVCHATGFGASAINFVLRFWISDAENGVTNIKGEVLIALYDALTEAGIELPFPQYEIRLKDDRLPGDRLSQQKPNAAE